MSNSAAATATTEATGTTTTTSANEGATTTPPDWTNGLPDDARGFIQNKGWKSNADLLGSYQNLEKLVGVPQENLLKLPIRADDKEGWNKIYSRLGRPEKPEDYKIEAPKEGGDPDFAKWAAGTFHELGLTAAQAQSLTNKYNELATSRGEQAKQATAAKTAEAEAALKKEWGSAYDQNSKQVEMAAKRLEMGEEQLKGLHAAMGPVDAMKFVHNLATKLGEAKFHDSTTGNPTFGVLTPEAARMKVKTLMSDPVFKERLNRRDPSAQEEWERLHKQMTSEF